MKKILLVDDSPTVSKMTEKFLTENGFQVVGIGRDGFEGAQLYIKTSPDLVLLDLTMPNRDGRDCLKDILTIDPHARVIMVSALKNDEVVNECLTLGAKAYIEKPLRLMDPSFATTFRSKIERILS